MNGASEKGIWSGLLLAGLALAARGQGEQALPEGYWNPAQVRALLDRTLTVRLAPSLDTLDDAQRRAVGHLLDAGAIVQRLYESSLHPEALAAHAQLVRLDQERGNPPATRDLLDLYRLFHGPIAITLENQRVPFLPVAAESPGRNVYPTTIAREEVEAWFATHPPSREALLDKRSVVRRASLANVRADLAALDRHPELDALHPGLFAELSARLATPDEHYLYAAPYSLAWADEIARVRDHLVAAAAEVARSDADFAQYLRLRARDLQSDDYEGGDAAWVRGDFGTLNAQIGSYETYDDKLYGTKTFFSLSVLMRDAERSAPLARATASLQRLQDALPYEGKKKVQEDISIGVYHVIADFGQARSANTASILPNDPYHVRKYGRTILIRHNLISNPALFEDSRAGFAAALPAHAGDLTPDGELLRVLWHEIGHYLGPDRAPDGRPVGEALAEYGNLIEEMKADLVSLWAAPAQREAASLDPAGLRAWYASGIRRVLQKVQPLREQPYQTMQLMQMNYFLEHGLLAHRDGQLTIDYARYPEVVASLLEQVLALQASGERAQAAAFVERYATWDDAVHGAVARRIDAASSARYRLIRYEALGE